MPQQLRVGRKLIMEPGAIVEGSWGLAFDRGGRTYYVNNITGSSTNDGLSWNAAMDEVSTAVTASETFRELGGSRGDVTTNDYIRNTIVVQGTATAYTGITDLGEYYDLIGLGVPSGGIGGTIWNTTELIGMARLGSDDVSTGGMYDADGSYSGVYVANIHFQTGGTNPAFGVATLYQSRFDDCGFYYAKDQATAAPNSWFQISGATGLIMNRCAGAGNAGVTDRPLLGFEIVDGTDRFSHCRMRDCQWTGSTAAFSLPETCHYCQGTIIGPDNFFGSFGHGVCNTGIRDLNLKTEALGGLATYIHNYCDAINPIQQHAGFGDWTRFIDNRAPTGELIYATA